MLRPMAQALTVKQMARMGGIARAKKLTKKRRREIATQGAKALWGQKSAQGVPLAK